jgi:dihydroorotase
VKVLPCGNMTKGGKGEEMAGIGSLKKAGVVALSDDGKCIQDHGLMRHVVEYAKSFNLPIMDHCEETTLAAGGVMNEGKWSVLLGMNGISKASEELIIARNIIFAREIGWKIHMQHVSTRESVDMLRRARAKGIPVTGEATPHHLTLTDECVKKFDTNYKMNPPLRSEDDRQALIEGIADGTITVIATDHAPHTETAKLVEFDHAPFGIIGLETAFPVCFTQLVASGIISISQLIARMTTGPAEVLGFENYDLSVGKAADITVFDPEAEYVVDKNKFYSKSRNTPFDGMSVRGQINLTIVDGKIVYRQGC